MLAATGIALGAGEAHAEEASTAQAPTPNAPSAAQPAGRPAPLGDAALPVTGRSRHVDVGSSLVVIAPVANSIEAAPPKLHYEVGPGISAYARIPLCDYLGAALVFSWATHGVSMDAGALGLEGAIDSGPMTSYRLEAHVLPTLPIGERVRLNAIAGLGWGRLEIGPMHVADGDQRPYLVRGRGSSYFDVPLGLGVSIELIPRWLALDVSSWAAPTFAKHGTAHAPIEAIDASGVARAVGPLPEVPVWFVQSAGLSVLL